MSKITKIKKEGKPNIYVEDSKDILKFLPSTPLLSMRMYGSNRIMVYDDGEYMISISDKVKGIYAGNICTICGNGEVVDMGGCATCSLCGCQLKCGI